MRLHLIRHPAPDVPAGYCYGRLDVALAADVAHCLSAIRDALPCDPASVPIWSSPLKRCAHLALALHPAPRVEARLIELDFGDWEGKAWDAIDRNALDAWAADPLRYVIPGGEAVADMQTRVDAALDELAVLPSADVVWVTHAGVIKLVLARANRLALPDWLGQKVPFASVTTIAWHATAGIGT
jgi:alpha-ribazole phosphatase